MRLTTVNEIDVVNLANQTFLSPTEELLSEFLTDEACESKLAMVNKKIADGSSYEPVTLFGRDNLPTILHSIISEGTGLYNLVDLSILGAEKFLNIAVFFMAFDDMPIAFLEKHRDQLRNYVISLWRGKWPSEACDAVIACAQFQLLYPDERVSAFLPENAYSRIHHWIWEFFRTQTFDIYFLAVLAYSRIVWPEKNLQILSPAEVLDNLERMLNGYALYLTRGSGNPVTKIINPAFYVDAVALLRVVLADRINIDPLEVSFDRQVQQNEIPQSTLYT